jgi:hypothetical protein
VPEVAVPLLLPTIKYLFVVVAASATSGVRLTGNPVRTEDTTSVRAKKNEISLFFLFSIFAFSFLKIL